MKTPTPKILIWINDNFDSIALILVYVCSIIPFFTQYFKPTFYNVMGILLGGLSMYYIKTYAKEDQAKTPQYKTPDYKESSLFSKLASVTLILGVLGALFVVTNDDNSLEDASVYKFLYTHMGALFGMILGGFIFQPLKTNT